MCVSSASATDVPRLLAAADIHCQPNISPEPFGIAFIEALAAGLPVVTSAIGGAIEIVDDTCGRLVPASDPGRPQCGAPSSGGRSRRARPSRCGRQGPRAPTVQSDRQIGGSTPTLVNMAGVPARA